MRHIDHLFRPINIKLVRIIFFSWVVIVAIVGFAYIMIQNQQGSKASAIALPPRPCLDTSGKLSDFIPIGAAVTPDPNKPIQPCPTATKVNVTGTAPAACLAAGNTCMQGLTGRSLGTCCSGTSCVVPRGVADANGTCQYSTIAIPTSATRMCLQVITKAFNATTGECRLFSNSCLEDGFVRSDTCTIGTSVSPTTVPTVAACLTENTVCMQGLTGRSLGSCCTGFSCSPRQVGVADGDSICKVSTPRPTTPPGQIGDTCNINADCQTGLACDASTKKCKSGIEVLGNTVSLNLRLKLQGIARRPNSATSIPVTIILQRGSVKVSQSQAFTADANGIWSNPNPFVFVNTQAGNNFALFIKAGQHLQKKICDLNPQEPKDEDGEPLDLKYSCRDTAALTLNSGLNTLDLTGISMPACDLPIDGHQDGVCDSLDMAFLTANDQSHEAPVLAVGDLNHDGVINVIDRNIVRYVLSTQRDEER